MAREPFGSDDELPEIKSPLRIKSPQKEESQAQTQPQQPKPIDLKKQAEFSERATRLTNQFKKAFDSSLLPENKSSKLKDEERRLVQEFSQLALEINADPTQSPGMGSVAISGMQLRLLLDIRDKLNTLDYRITVLEEEQENKK